MNLDKLIDQWIGEDITKGELSVEELDKLIVRNELRQDLKSRKQELVDGIESFYASQK